MGEAWKSTLPAMAESIAQFFSEHYLAHLHERAFRQKRGYRTESFTYGDVLKMALGFAGQLEARGTAKGDRVMVWGENCAEWLQCSSVARSAE